VSTKYLGARLSVRSKKEPQIAGNAIVEDAKRAAKRTRMGQIGPAFWGERIPGLARLARCKNRQRHRAQAAAQPGQTLLSTGASFSTRRSGGATDRPSMFRSSCCHGRQPATRKCQWTRRFPRLEDTNFPALEGQLPGGDILAGGRSTVLQLTTDPWQPVAALFPPSESATTSQGELTATIRKCPPGRHKRRC
jgi:hypothetical protein